ncbi:MAG: hypothetical protein EOP37_03350 [Rubrivivax sp.]|nr:MAG: hypothetical protein EOP37_03350 [Rubrivivax sp.]
MPLPTIPDVLPNSLAHRVAAHMLRNTDTALNSAEIAEKYDVARDDVDQQLVHAVTAGVLHARERMIKNVANVIEYSAGPKVLALAAQRASVAQSADATTVATWPGRPAKTSAEGKGLRARASRLPALDISKLVVETGVGFALPNRKGLSRWDDVFDLLTEPGMSTSMDDGYKNALKKAAALYEQRNPGRKFSFGKCPKNPDNCRVLRRA